MPIRESDLLIPTLRALAASSNGFVSTSELIDHLEHYFTPSGVDAQTLTNRNDTHFSQKVRNLVSHRNANTGLEARGWATYDQQRQGWQITDIGRNLLDQVNELNS